MQIFLNKLFDINKTPTFTGNRKQERIPRKKISLENIPNDDLFVKSPQKKKVSSPKDSGIIPSKLSPDEQFLVDYKTVVKDNILGRELTALIFAGVDDKNPNSFTTQQKNIVKLAAKRIAFFKAEAEALNKLGNEHIESVLTAMSDMFGGKDQLGKYIQARIKNGKPVAKDSVSIYNKLIKEFKSTYIKGKILDGISIPQFGQPYSHLGKDEKKLIRMSSADADLVHNVDFKALESVLKINSKSRKEASDWIRDLVGIRLVLPDDVDMSEVEDYIKRAALSGQTNITKISNYHSSHIYPYISKNTLELLRESIPGLYVVSSSEVRKKNGYTTTQMNIIHNILEKNDKEIKINCELQIRSHSLNKIGQIEHWIYDILENKDISKGIPELKEFLDATGIVNAVNDVFNDPKKEEAYLEYEKTAYAKIRENEKKNKNVRSTDVEYPLLADFGLGAYDVLSFESLEYINNKASLIMKKYSNKK